MHKTVNSKTPQNCAFKKQYLHALLPCDSTRQKAQWCYGSMHLMAEVSINYDVRKMTRVRWTHIDQEDAF